MPDTIRGDFPDTICSDCGEKGCVFRHWGPLVPEGKVGDFCGYCWTRRDKLGMRVPLGFQPPGIPEEFINKNLKVFTESGAIYRLILTENDGERIVSKENAELSFTRARVMELKTGEPLWLKPHDDQDLSSWWCTTPVVRVVAE